jgi:hypothetical protein
MVSTAQTDSSDAITPRKLVPRKFGAELTVPLKRSSFEESVLEGRYLPMRIKMPAASANIPIMIVGMVMWNSRVIPASIR